MNTRKPSSILLMGALLLQSVLFSAVPQSVRAAEDLQFVTTRLIISAVQITGGTGHTQEDFVELYNPTSQPIDLNGYRLVKRTAAGTSDTAIQIWSDAKVILPYHFFLWANANYTSLTVTPDATSSGTLADNNGVALRYGASDTGEIVDSVAWGSAANIFRSVSTENPSANNSLVRNDFFGQNNGFAIKTSFARNSSVELLPPVPTLPDPELSVEPEPVPETPIEELQESPVETPEQLPGNTPETPMEQPADPEVVPEPEQSSDPEPQPQPEPENLPEVPEQEVPAEEELEIDLRITELLPNPSGNDSGLEKIEIYNAGPQSVNLLAFRIDDVASIDAVSSNAYTFPSIEIESNDYFVLTIPIGKFSLNNTSGDVITLFDSQGVPVDSIEYIDTTPEAKSYSYFESGWAWASPTFGESNGNPPVIEEESVEVNEEDSQDLGEYDNSSLEISEIYVDPISRAKEFVEIYNAGEEVAQLSVVSIWVGEKSKKLPDLALQPGEWYVIPQDDLPAQLRNSGQLVKLEEDDQILSTVTYPLAIDGASYARFEDGFLWTTSVTSGKSNVLVLPEVVKKEVIAKATKPAVTKATAKKATAKPTVKPVATKTAAKPAVSAAKTEPVKDVQSESIQEENKASDKKPKDSLGKIIAMGAAAVAAGIIALYKLVFTSGIE